MVTKESSSFRVGSVNKKESTILNKQIEKLDSGESLAYEPFGGKVIPYIGWYWRTVDFTAKDYSFGILPVCDNIFEENDKPRVAFMENNKWGYDYCYCPPEKWNELIVAIKQSLKSRTKDHFVKIESIMQSLIDKDGKSKYKEMKT